MAFVSEENRQAYDVMWQRQQGKLGLHDYSQGSFASDEPIDRIVGKRVADGIFLEIRSSQLDQLSACHHDFESSYVSAGSAPLLTFCAPRLGRKWSPPLRLFFSFLVAAAKTTTAAEPAGFFSSHNTT